MPTLHVVAAIIHKGDKIFATQRGYGEHKDKWEFPGGKVETGESSEAALIREIREELDADISITEFLTTVEYDYPAFHLLMDCFIADLTEGSDLKLKEHEAARWLSRDELDSVDWLPADVEVVKAILRTSEGNVSDNWRQSLHLEPPTGWMNDPNGLCYAGGKYHVFFQYTPEAADGSGLRRWGHYESADDGRSWEFTGTFLSPDIPEDRTGVFSGSAVTIDGVIHIFYTGNVELEGNYDYVTSGREANQIHVISANGRVAGPKSVILRNSDYPAWCSCHVRDPKVWIDNGLWKMVLGARTLDDKGCVLFYETDDPEHWTYVKSMSVPDFGYMWECPDLFTVEGKVFLGVSPQGLPHDEFRFQNAFSSGYFRVAGDRLCDFEEFDYGFDFYAPQTFVDKNGDRILIGWMGIGDSSYTNPTVDLGWQHCLTLPRRLSLAPDGSIRQEPVIHSDLLGKTEIVEVGQTKAASLPCDITVPSVSGAFLLKIEDVQIRYDGSVLVLDLEGAASGYGRKIRKVKTGPISDLRVICDRSSIEVFADRGRYVMSTRFYPEDKEIEISGSCELQYMAIGERKVAL